MRINLSKAAFIIGVMLIVILCIVLVSRNRVHNGQAGLSATSIDSLYNAMDQLPVGKYEAAVAREQVKAYYSGNLELYDKISKYFEQRAEKDNNKIARSYIKSNKASILLYENKPDSALMLAKEAEKDAEGTTVVGLGNIYNTIASSY